MSRIVCKFGGSSVADAAQFRKVKDIVRANPKRRIVVPSAPGKRVSSEAKLTDLLYLCHDSAVAGADFSGPFGLIRDRYLGIEKELGLKTRMAGELDKLNEELKKGVPSRDFVASRGEYYSGILMAAFLDGDFVDPADYVIIDTNGCANRRTYEILGARLADDDRMYVMPGFYGKDHDGKIKTFSRGGSDISGAIAARAAKADIYENWTDVSGLLMADPKLVDGPKTIAEISYREIRELSYMGASVFHDEAILPVREAGIPINIRNTNRPQDPGTLIVSKLSAESIEKTLIAGIAGKKDFTMISLEKSLMNKELGFAYRLLGIFEKNGISVEHAPSSIDTMSVIVEKRELGDKADLVMEEIQRILQPDRIAIERNLAMIAVVGEGMTHTVGIASRVFKALADARVNVRVINQGASELNIIVGVAGDDLQKAVRVLYGAFIDK